MSFKKTITLQFGDESLDLVQLTRQQILDCAALDNLERGYKLILLSCFRDGKPFFSSVDEIKEALSFEAEEAIAEEILEHNGLKKKMDLHRSRLEKSVSPMQQDSPIPTICEQNLPTSNIGT